MEKKELNLEKQTENLEKWKGLLNSRKSKKKGAIKKTQRKNTEKWKRKKHKRAELRSKLFSKISLALGFREAIAP
jgi:hypothetical protein